MHYYSFHLLQEDEMNDNKIADAEKVRSRGNVLFKQGLYEGALKCYENGELVHCLYLFATDRYSVLHVFL